MPDVGTVFNFIFPLLSVLALGGCALLFGVQTTLRANNGDLKERVGILESEQRSDKQTIAAQAEQISAHQGELTALSKVVTGEVQLVAITDLLTAHHTQAVKEWEQVNSILIRIDTTMAGALALLRDIPPPRSRKPPDRDG